MIVVGRCLVVQVGVTAGAQGNEIARRLVKNVNVAHMMDVICAKAAFSTPVIVAFERVSLPHFPIR